MAIKDISQKQFNLGKDNLANTWMIQNKSKRHPLSLEVAGDKFLVMLGWCEVELRAGLVLVSRSGPEPHVAVDTLDPQPADTFSFVLNVEFIQSSKGQFLSICQNYKLRTDIWGMLPCPRPNKNLSWSCKVGRWEIILQVRKASLAHRWAWPTRLESRRRFWFDLS